MARRVPKLAETNIPAVLHRRKAWRGCYPFSPLISQGRTVQMFPIARVCSAASLIHIDTQPLVAEAPTSEDRFYLDVPLLEEKYPC